MECGRPWLLHWRGPKTAYDGPETAQDISKIRHRARGTVKSAAVPLGTMGTERGHTHARARAEAQPHKNYATARRTREHARTRASAHAHAHSCTTVTRSPCTHGTRAREPSWRLSQSGSGMHGGGAGTSQAKRSPTPFWISNVRYQQFMSWESPKRKHNVLEPVVSNIPILRGCRKR